MNSKSALLIIDMQSALVAGAHLEKETLEAINSVIADMRAQNLPVIFIQHNHASYAGLMKNSDGWQIHPLLDRREEDPVIEKTASDAFYQTTLQKRLEGLCVDTLVVTGMQTEFCVDATCRSALSRNFDVVLIADGHTTGPSHLSAAAIIDHHNRILQNLAHPSSTLTLLTADELITQ